MKHFNVVIPNDTGGMEFSPMKEWLRCHPDKIPPGLDPTLSTSHQLRNGLRGLGWTVQETESQVRLIPPGSTFKEAEIESILGDDNAEEEIEAEPQEACFALEYQLRDFLAQNIGAVNVLGKKLKLYVDPSGRDGIEYPTAVGPMDILAIDDSGAFYIFELKRARSPDHAIGQLARYMGWTRQTIGKNTEVFGIIVAKEIGDKLRYAISAVPNVTLFEYAVEFHLKLANNLKPAGE